MEIHELHGVEGRGYYTEGTSEVVAYIDREVKDVMNPSQWFCFETDSFAEMAMELQKIGFTATQILEARPTFTALDEYEAQDDRPWGEQQGQIDWLESRYDTPMYGTDDGEPDDPRAYD